MILGYVYIEGVDDITMVLFNPPIAEYVRFKNRFA